MIDPRISLAVRAPDVAPAINIFENALMNAQRRDIAAAQEARQAELQPFRVQQAQREQAIGRQGQILKSVNDFALGNQSLINEAQSTGDFSRLRGALVQRRDQLEQQGLPTETTDDGLALIDAGKGGQVISSLGDAVKLFNQQSGLQRPVQFGAQQTFKDSKGNLFFGTTKRNPITGEVDSVLASVSGDQSQPEGQVSLVSGLGQTAAEKAETEVSTTQQVEDIKATAKGKSEAVKAGVGQAVKAFEKIPLVKTAINNYGEAIAALDAGAETGTIDAMLPSLTRASKELDNVIKRLGLDVVGNTTFGALSESELKFALKAAIPNNLQPAQLKEWLTAKRNAQQKILGGLNEMANFLGDGTKTIADWNNQQALKSLSGTSQTEQAPAAEATPVTFSSPALNREISEQDITDTLQANPGLTRDQLLQQLGVING